MLTQCPECELPVSSNAEACPHCGNPLRIVEEVKKRRKTNRRMKLPNGFGQISEIKNQNLRKPFRAMITVGKNERGKPICKLLQPVGYFETYNEAYAALVKYNSNPYELDSFITVKELYERWSEEHFKKGISLSRIKCIKSAWKYCSSLYNMKVVDLRIYHIKDCVENGTINTNGKIRKPSPSMKMNIKTIFDIMLDYAVEYELVDKNLARNFSLSADVSKEMRKNKKDHIPFTDEEINLLWENINSDQFIDMILIQCYSGWRPRELCSLKLEDVDMEKRSFRGGMKTEAGENRIIPIHSKIQHLVKNRYEHAKSIKSKYLFTNVVNGKNINYELYFRHFSKIVKHLSLNTNHKPHDGRVHFVTMAKKYNVDEYAIKYIVGHSIEDLTEKTYTKREFGWLREEIEKIK